MADQQDLRRLGGLVNLLPFTYTCILIGSLSLMALPGLTGFYTKDHIIELAGGVFTIKGYVIYWFATISAGLTAFYSYRLVTLTFFGEAHANRNSYMNAHEADYIMIVPMVILAILSIFFGYVAKDLWLGMGTDYLGATMPQAPGHLALIEADFGLPLWNKLLPLALTLTGAISSYYLFTNAMRFANSLTSTSFGRTIYTFINGQWQWNAFINGLIINPMLSLGHIISKEIDRGIVETVGPYGLSTVLPRLGNNISNYDTSVVTTYALYVVIGFLSIIFILFAPYLYTSGTDNNIINDIALLLLFVSGIGLTGNNRSVNNKV
jgi:NADH-ubiquinone oxidoreductase chain 5